MGGILRARGFILLEAWTLALGGALAAYGQTGAGHIVPQSPKSGAQPSSAASSPAAPPAMPAGSKSSWSISIGGAQAWTDTDVDIRRGDTLKLSATGSVNFESSESTGPAGFPRTWSDLLRQLQYNGAGRGALIGRIGSDATALPFLVGPSLQMKVTRGGRLYLGVNEAANESAEGKFQVNLEVERAAGGSSAAAVLPATAVEVASMPGLPANLLARIPRRVTDQQGHPGDMVNFLVLGSEDQMKQAFAAAGWVQVDRTKSAAVIHSLIATLSKQAYVEMPMSELYLFGRPQDFGMAHAEPLSVIATRHHLRLWKAPFEVAGQTLWVGAATHDIGFERDTRNGRVTHKIDAAVDDERKFVAASLSDTGLVSALTYLTPSDPLTEARTATGGVFHSDGRILVLRLAPTPSTR
jgi:LssY C-terminus